MDRDVLECSLDFAKLVDPMKDVLTGQHGRMRFGGIDVDEALAAFGLAARLPSLKLVGTHCHIGSQIARVEPYLEALDHALALLDRIETAHDIRLEHLNIDGSFAIPYYDRTADKPDTYFVAPHSLDGYAAGIGERLQKARAVRRSAPTAKTLRPTHRLPCLVPIESPAYEEYPAIYLTGRRFCGYTDPRVQHCGGLMDVLDREILIALQQDGRQTNAHLAEQLGLSASAMHERVRRLERDGLVRGFHADVVPEGLGVGLQAFVTAELNAHSRDLIEGFEKGVLSLPEARACYHVTGRFDYLLHVAVRDLAHLGRLIKTDIAAIPGVAKLETLLVLTEVKADAGWPAFNDD